MSLIARVAASPLLAVCLVLASATLGFIQEHRASRALAELQARLRTVCRVRRGGQVESVSLDEIVPGDNLRSELSKRFAMYREQYTLPVRKKRGVVPV